MLAEARQSQRKLSVRGSRCREGGEGGEAEMEKDNGVKNGMRPPKPVEWHQKNTGRTETRVEIF